MEFKGRTIWNGQHKPAEIIIKSEHAHTAKSPCLQHFIVADNQWYDTPTATLDETRALLEAHGYRFIDATWDTNGKKQYMSKGNALPRAKTWRYTMSALALAQESPLPAHTATWERVAVNELRPGDIIVERTAKRTVKFPLRNFSKWQIIFADRSVLYAEPDATFVVERPTNSRPVKPWKSLKLTLTSAESEDEPQLVRRDVDDYVAADWRTRAHEWRADSGED